MFAKTLSFTSFLRDVGIGLAFLLAIAWMAGCAASPRTMIYINKSIKITQPKEKVDFSYETNSGVSSANEFDGEVKPQTDLKITPR